MHDPEHCTGGNLCINYFGFVFSDTPASSSSLEINNSEFWRGVSGIEPEQPLRFAGGLTIVVGVVNHDIHITINNTVIAENSGILAGNVAIGMFGTEHVTVRLGRCYIQSGNVTKTWSSWTSVPTGLTYVGLLL